MPKVTYVSKEVKSVPGHKVMKQRVSLLLGRNIAGFKVKPFLIYMAENPCALKNVNKHTLPVHYRYNCKAQMTMDLFEDWFLNCFIPAACHYCQEKGIPFKILLILDSVPAHPPHLEDLDPNV